MQNDDEIAIDLLGLIRGLFITDEIDLALDILYDRVDRWMQQGNFQLINILLGHANPWSLGEDLAIGLISATMCAKTILPTREIFLQKFRLYLRRYLSNEDVVEILKGL